MGEPDRSRRRLAHGRCSRSARAATQLRAVRATRTRRSRRLHRRRRSSRTPRAPRRSPPASGRTCDDVRRRDAAAVRQRRQVSSRAVTGSIAVGDRARCGSAATRSGREWFSGPDRRGPRLQPRARRRPRSRPTWPRRSRAPAPAPQRRALGHPARALSLQRHARRGVEPGGQDARGRQHRRGHAELDGRPENALVAVARRAGTSGDDHRSRRRSARSPPARTRTDDHGHAPGRAASPKTVPVTFTVDAAAAVLAVTPASLAFSATGRRRTRRPRRSRSTTPAAGRWTGRRRRRAVARRRPAAAPDAGTVAVTADVDGLARGHAHRAVTSRRGAPRTIPVTLTVDPLTVVPPRSASPVSAGERSVVPGRPQGRPARRRAAHCHVATRAAAGTTATWDARRDGRRDVAVAALTATDAHAVTRAPRRRASTAPAWTATGTVRRPTIVTGQTPPARDRTTAEHRSPVTLTVDVAAAAGAGGRAGDPDVHGVRAPRTRPRRRSSVSNTGGGTLELHGRRGRGRGCRSRPRAGAHRRRSVAVTATRRARRRAPTRRP